MDNLNIDQNEKIAGVPLARLMRNLDETSYNEGAVDLACRLTDCKAVIEALLSSRATNATIQQGEDKGQRGEFEAWATDHLGQGYPLTMDEGTYEHPVTRWALKAWLAGRRSATSTQQGEDLPPLPRAKYLLDVYHEDGRVTQIGAHIDDDMREYGASCRASAGDARDAARLLFAMQDFDGFVGVKMDKYDYAIEVATENGREEPTATDELNGVRRLIDAALAAQPGK